MGYRAVLQRSYRQTAQEDFFYLTSWRLKGLAVLRIAFGIVWAVDAKFKWQPAFPDKFTGYLQGALGGQVLLVTQWISFWLHIVSINPHLFAYMVALGETGIALGLLLGVFSNLTYCVGILLSVLIWSTAQGFGGPYGPNSTDIGVSIIYVLVFIGLFLGGAGLSFGLDRRLSLKLGRWSFLASGSIKQSSIPTRLQPFPVGTGADERRGGDPRGRPSSFPDERWGEDPRGRPSSLHPMTHTSVVPRQSVEGATTNTSTHSRLTTIRGQRLSRM